MFRTKNMTKGDPRTEKTIKLMKQTNAFTLNHIKNHFLELKTGLNNKWGELIVSSIWTIPFSYASAQINIKYACLFATDSALFSNTLFALTYGNSLNLLAWNVFFKKWLFEKWRYLQNLQT